MHGESAHSPTDASNLGVHRTKRSIIRDVGRSLIVADGARPARVVIRRHPIEQLMCDLGPKLVYRV